MVNSYDEADSYSAGDGLDHFPGYLRFKWKEAQDTKGKQIPLFFLMPNCSKVDALQLRIIAVISGLTNIFQHIF